MLDPSEARLWAETVARLMADVENRLIWIIKDSAERGLGAPSYSVKRLAELATVRARLERELGRSWPKVIRKVQAVLDEARAAGQGMAIRDLEHAGLPDRLPDQMAIGIEAIAADTMLHLTRMPALILRDAVDAYQQIMATPVTMVTTGATTRLQATQEALTRFAKHGIDSFTDKAGRRWRIDSYAEMATRTGALHSMRFGYERTLTLAGEDLVMVTSHGYTCSKCGPWEGKILSLTGRTPTGWNVAEHATQDGVMVRFQVAGTLAEAREAGLFHPNCGHGMAMWLPGVSTPAEPGRDPKTYEASQQQRALERDIRLHKRELAAAITPEAATEARKKIRANQARIRDLIEAHPKLTRKSVREQIRTAH